MLGIRSSLDFSNGGLTMKINIFDNMLNVVVQRGVLVLSEAFGFGYLFLAQRSSPIHRDEAVVGLILVFMGACFEYLVTMAKVRYASADIVDRKKENEHLHARLDAGVRYIEDKHKEIQADLAKAGKGSLQSATIAKIQNEDEE